MAGRMSPKEQIGARMRKAAEEFRASKAQVDSVNAAEIRKAKPAPAKRPKVQRVIYTQDVA